MVPSSPVPMAPSPWPSQRPDQSGPLRTVLGLALLGPAALVALISLVVPTIQTIRFSFQRGVSVLPIRGGRGLGAEFVGADNYLDVLGTGGFWTSLGFTLSLAALPLLSAVVVAPLLAWVLDTAGPSPRRVGRLLMSVPLVLFAPVAFAAAWLTGMRDGGLETAFGELGSPNSARVAVVVISGLTTFGSVCGLALLGYLAVLRDRGKGRRVLPAALAVGGIAALATFAVSLQAFSLVYTMTRGGPARATETLSLFQFRHSFMAFDVGHGAAVATMTGLLLGVLGIAATVIAITAALRIDLAPSERATAGADRPGSPVAVLGAGAALAVVIAIVVIGAWPWLSALVSSADPRVPGPGSQADMRTYVNTWVPPLTSALVSVGAAFLAALGIGGLRPMGRHSEWLLLPFAPWLFVGIGPLSVAYWDNARSLDLAGSFAGLVPPMLISVPALVVLTLFCSGRALLWQARVAAGASAAAEFLRVVVLPALPLAAFLGGATVLVNAQGLLWPLLIATGPDDATAPVALVRSLFQFRGADIEVGYVTPLIVVVVALLALAALQILYLDRLTITVGRPAPAADPGPHPGVVPPPAPQSSPQVPPQVPPSAAPQDGPKAAPRDDDPRDDSEDDPED